MILELPTRPLVISKDFMVPDRGKVRHLSYRITTLHTGVHVLRQEPPVVFNPLGLGAHYRRDLEDGVELVKDGWHVEVHGLKPYDKRPKDGVIRSPYYQNIGTMTGPFSHVSCFRIYGDAVKVPVGTRMFRGRHRLYGMVVWYDPAAFFTAQRPSAAQPTPDTSRGKPSRGSRSPA